MTSEIEIVKIKRIDHGIIELRSDNILIFRPDVVTFKEYSVPVLKDLKKEFLKITDGIPRPYLCDNRYVTGIVNKEEQAYINENFGSFATHAAMVTNSPIVNALVNGYNYVFKPKVELRLFKNEKSAVDWLLKSYSRN